MPSLTRLSRCYLFGVLLALAVAPLVPPAAGAAPPQVKIENIRRVFHNGEHNAFTDLIRWRGQFWLTFRSCPDGHGVASTASIIVLKSSDTRTWTQVHQFAVPKRDTRDPHFLVFKEKLFIYTGTWYAGDGVPAPGTVDFNRHLGYAVWTADGARWEGPRHLEGTYGHYIWRVATHGDKAYLCGRRAYAGGRQSALLESDDGLIWRFRSLFQESAGNETAFHIEPDGALTAISRKTSFTSDLSRSRPPYTDWSRVELPTFIGGPLLTRWKDQWLVGGRRWEEQNQVRTPITTLYWLVGDELVRFAELPSGGDNSYPGFVELDDGRGLLSWYSTHEKNAAGEPITAIYLAELAAVK